MGPWMVQSNADFMGRPVCESPLSMPGLMASSARQKFHQSPHGRLEGIAQGGRASVRLVRNLPIVCFLVMREAARAPAGFSHLSGHLHTEVCIVRTRTAKKILTDYRLTPEQPRARFHGAQPPVHQAA